VDRRKEMRSVLCLLAVASVFVQSVPAFAAPEEVDGRRYIRTGRFVTVENSAANPIPVELQGTIPVEVTVENCPEEPAPSATPAPPITISQTVPVGVRESEWVDVTGYNHVSIVINEVEGGPYLTQGVVQFRNDADDGVFTGGKGQNGGPAATAYFPWNTYCQGTCVFESRVRAKYYRVADLPPDGRPVSFFLSNE
jgi:hypothetical protein